MASRSRLLGSGLLVAGVLLAAYLALSKPAPPIQPPTAAANEPAPTPTPNPLIPQQVLTPSTVATIDPSSVASAQAISAVTPHDARCGPDQRWVDDLSSHDQSGAGFGCLSTGADGGLLREGTWTYRGVDNLLHTGDYARGVEEGTWLTLYADNRKAEEGQYHNGVLDGWQTLWDPDGYKIAERHWKEGRLDGKVTITYPNGVVLTEEWQQGVRVDQPPPPPAPVAPASSEPPPAP